MTTGRPIRVLVAKPGLDGHDRGAKVIANTLRDAGMEVIYTGLRVTVEMVAEAALQEDVDVIGLSLLSGAHVPIVTRLMQLLTERGVHVPVVLGGVIPEADRPALRAVGVVAIFGQESSLEEMIESIRRLAREHQAAHG
jgi:methylmalonyl-CoA mutase C-terminal domain/subunit